MSDKDWAGTRDPLIVARFWSRVDVKRPGECWRWMAKSRGSAGHGVFRPTKESGLVKSHRFAWMCVNGPIPEGMVVRHRCDVADCCNPAHMLIGAQADNVADMHFRKRRRYKTRFTDQQITEVRDRYLAGETQKSIADEFGCTQSYISMIVRGVRGASAKKGTPNG